MRIYVEANTKGALQEIARAWGAVVLRNASPRDLRKAIVAAYNRVVDEDTMRAARARLMPEGGR